MSKIRNLEELREAIRDLEHQDYVNQQHMRQRAVDIADSLKPMNLLKHLFSQAVGSSGGGVKGGLFRMAAGLVTSFVVKKLFKKRLEKV